MPRQLYLTTLASSSWSASTRKWLGRWWSDCSGLSLLWRISQPGCTPTGRLLWSGELIICVDPALNFHILISARFIITLWYMHQYIRTYQEFSGRFPWLSRHVWALFLYDTVGWLPMEMYVWATMAEETWVHKNLKTTKNGDSGDTSEVAGKSRSLDEDSLGEDFSVDGRDVRVDKE